MRGIDFGISDRRTKRNIPVRLWLVCVLAFCLMALPSCVHQEGMRPDETRAISLEKAQQDIKKYVDITRANQAPPLPPRSVNDIVSILEDMKPDPQRVAELTLLADAPDPAFQNNSDRAKFLLSRGKARDELNRVDAAISDLMEASAISIDEVATTRLAKALLSNGDIYGSLSLMEKAIDSIEARGKGEGRLFVLYGLSAMIHSRIGNFDQAKNLLLKGDLLLLKAEEWSTYEKKSELWRSHLFLGKSQLERYRGNFKAALRYIDESIDNAVAAYEKKKKYLDSEDKKFAQLTGIPLKRSRRAKILLQLGKITEAEIEARNALNISLRHFGKYNTMTSFCINTLSQVLMSQGRFSEARILAQFSVDALENAGQQETSMRLGSTIRILAEADMFLDQPENALTLYDRLLNGTAKDPAIQKLLFENALEYGEAMLNAGRIQEAEGFLSDIFNRRRQTLGSKSYLTAEALGYLAAVHVHRDRIDKALPMFREASTVLLSVSRQVSDDSGDTRRKRRQRYILESYLSALDKEFASGPSTGNIVEESFRIGEVLRGGSVHQALTASSARALSTDKELRELVRSEQDTLRHISSLNMRVVEALNIPASRQNSKKVKGLRTEIDTLRGARAALREEIEKRFPNYAELIDPRPASIGQARNLLQENEALIATYVSRDRTYVWSISRGQATRFYSASLSKDNIREEVDYLRDSLNPDTSELAGIPRFDTYTAHRLYKAIFGPIAKDLASFQDLIIVQNGALGEIPFSTLVTEPHQFPDNDPGGPLFSDYRSIPFLVHKYAVTQLPSINSLIALRRKNSYAASRRPFIGFGDPLFNIAQVEEANANEASVTPPQSSEKKPGNMLASRGYRLSRRNSPGTRISDDADIAVLPRLPDTAAELKIIAAALNASPQSDVFTGASANEETVRSMDLTDRKVIMFATHGLVPGDLNGLMQPALALSSPAVSGIDGDGLLSIDEIVSLKIQADLVILSACNTAAGNGAGAEAVSGLGRAFFYAGARSLLVTHWPVETASAYTLTTQMFQQVKKDPTLNHARALQLAMLKLIRESGSEDPATGRLVYSYAHPFFWAPFSLVGDTGRPN